MLSVIRKVLDLFGKKGQWELIRLIFLTLLMAVVQTAGVASILPFMSLVSNPEMITENRWMSSAYETLGFSTTRSFLIFAGLMVLAITAISNAFTALNQWIMVRYVWRKQYQISVRLLKQYLTESYLFHLNRNSATLAKNILAEVNEVVNGLVVPGMKMLANVIVVAFIFALLLLVDVALAVVSVIVLGGIYALIYTAVRKRQSRLGKIRRDANGLRFKTAGEALGAIKETLVLGRSEEFLKRFSEPARQFSTATAANTVISDIPRYAVETIAFGGIILVMLYILGTRQDFGQAVAIMSLYAFAGYRLMPALQLIFHGFARVRFFAPALDHLHEDLVVSRRSRDSAKITFPESKEPLPFERDVLVDNISFKYPGRDSWVAREITLRIERNTTIGFVGSTGSGKTTLVDVILGLLDPQEGCIRIDGVPITAENLAAWRKHIGYVPQHIFLSDDTIARNIGFGLADSDLNPAEIHRAARTAHIHDFVMSLPEGYETIVGEKGVRLSGGQRQRIGIARALYADPDVLIMDEATSALDGITEEGVMEAIDQLSHQKTIILVAHRISTLRDCDCIYLFQDGQVAAFGTYENLLAESKEFRAMAKIGLELTSPRT
jgi:ABC-type multidrug transport system fused ATPase/permease subunit